MKLRSFQLNSEILGYADSKEVLGSEIEGAVASFEGWYYFASIWYCSFLSGVI